MLLWEDSAVRLEGVREREHGVVDIVMVLAIVSLALFTWSYFSGAGNVSLWKLYTGIAIAWFLALAALTRHPHRSASIRLLAGGWMIAAPYLLNFTDIAPARWSYVAIGTIVTVMGLPGVVTHATRRDPMTV
jgi:SPW repeat